MAYTKKTLRKMTKTPETRKVAEVINDLDKSLKKLKRLLPVIQRLEFQSQALKHGQHPQEGDPPTASKELEIKPTKKPKTLDPKSVVNPPEWDDLDK